jgi:NTE family protein
MRRALVLGGGGITGIAWEIGVLAGLAEAGVDLTGADVIIGTSAGSVVGALVASGTPLAELYANQIQDLTGEEVSARFRPLDMLRFFYAALWPGSDETARRRMGRMALRVSDASDVLRRGVMQSRLGDRTWPDRELLITAVDADTGEPRVFDRRSGVPLVDAVRASCAVPLVWPPVEIEGHRYMDGGMRSITNADLAAGCDRVVVIAPVTVAFRRTGGIARQLASLGPQVRSVVTSPDDGARAAIGRNVLSPVTRAASARAGRIQAAREAGRISGVWSAA